MRFSYDPRYNIAYLRFRKKSSDVETICVSDELNVDLTPDGKIYGIEFWNANEQLLKEDFGKLFVVNETTGVESEVALDPK